MTSVAYRHQHMAGKCRDARTDRALVWMPAQSALRAILDKELERLPQLKDAPLVINLKGRRYTESGLRASFFKLIRELVKEGKVDSGLTFHGLRVTLATAIAEAGGDTEADCGRPRPNDGGNGPALRPIRRKKTRCPPRHCPFGTAREQRC